MRCDSLFEQRKAYGDTKSCAGRWQEDVDGMVQGCGEMKCSGVADSGPPSTTKSSPSNTLHQSLLIPSFRRSAASHPGLHSRERL